MGPIIGSAAGWGLRSSTLAALSLMVALLLGAGAALGKPEFPADLDRRCTNDGRLPSNPAEIARSTEPVLGDCALCHDFNLALGRVPEGGNVTSDGNAYKRGDLDPFCVLPEINSPPTLAPIGNATVDAGSLLSFLVMAADGDADPLAFAIDPLPAGATFVDGGDGIAVFEWTPGASDVGNHPVGFSVTDGMDTASESIVIAVTPVQVPPPGNRPPMVALIDDVELELGEALRVPVSATDPDGNGLAFGMAGLPASAELVDFGDGTAEIVWAPEMAGSSLVAVSVMDDGKPPLSAEETFVIRVLEPPVPGDLRLDDAMWSMDRSRIRVWGSGAPAEAPVELLDAESGALLAVRLADEAGGFRASQQTFLAPCSVQARAGAAVSEILQVRNAPADCGKRLLTELRRVDWQCRKQRIRIAAKGAPPRADVTVLDADSLEPIAQGRTDDRGKLRLKQKLSVPPSRVSLAFASGDGEWRLEDLDVERFGRCRAPVDDEDESDEDDEDDDEDESDEDDDEDEGEPVN